MKKLFTKLAIGLLSLLFAITAYSQGGVKGQVTDEDTGEPLIGATVVLYNLQGGVVKGEITDTEGNYSIEGITSGSYLFKVSTVGYGDYSQDVEIGDSMLEIQVSSSESISALDVVTITAGRRAEKVHEASANIQVVDARTIEVTQEPTTYGLLKNVNGIDYVETGLGQQQIQARGFASIFTGGLLTLVDYRSVTLPGIGGVFGPAMGVNQNDIKQIEVIVGPNSALYGANAANGVVNIITKNPKEYAGNSILVRGGNQSLFTTQFRSSNMLSDKFGYKISGEYFRAEDFDQSVQLIAGGTETGIFTNPNNDIENNVFSGSLYYFPSDNTEISLSGGRAVANYVNQSNIGPLQVDDFTFWYYQGRASFSNFLNFGSAFLQVNYTENDAKNTYNLETVAQAVAGGMSEAAAIEAATFFDKPTRLTAEFQHNVEFVDNNFITWGTQFTDTKPDSGGTFLSDGPNGEQIQIKEFGAYIQYENEMVKDVNLTVSARYDDNDNFGSQVSPKFSLSFTPSTHNFRFAWNQAFSSPPLQPAFALTPITTLQTQTEVAPGVFVDSDPIQMVLRGAKDTGFTIVDGNGAQVGSVAPLSPTITQAWELGYKGLLFDKLYIDVTYFNSKTKDFLSAPIPINNPGLSFGGNQTGLGWGDLAFTGGQQMNPVTFVEGFENELVLTYFNYGEVKSQGINASMDYQFNNNFSAYVAYQWVSFDEFTDVPITVTATPITNQPTQTWRFGMKYTDKAGRFASIGGRWVEGYDVLSAREYTSGKISSYTVIDLKAETPINAVEGLNFGIGVNNLFNQEYQTIPGTAEIGMLASAHVRYDF